MFANKANFNSIFFAMLLNPFFSIASVSGLPKGVGERRFPLSLFIGSVFLLPPETPENSGYFFTMGCSATFVWLTFGRRR